LVDGKSYSPVGKRLASYDALYGFSEWSSHAFPFSLEASSSLLYRCQPEERPLKVRETLNPAISWVIYGIGEQTIQPNG
jgi:hypothetical protein